MIPLDSRSQPLGRSPNSFLFPGAAAVLGALLAALPIVSAVPVAVDDAFEVDEDGTLQVSGGGILVSAAFGGEGETAVGGTWDFLDRIENENGATHGYPVDGGGRAWNETGFEVSTSSVGPWSSGAAPLQAGAIDGFPPGTPALLFGIGAAGNGENLVTTYLFRHDFTLGAAEAAEGSWQIDYLFDDGGIVYLNGVEVLRTPNMPAGPVATTTYSASGDEATVVSASLDLAGRLVEGENTIAVEVHQAAPTSSDAGFLLTLRPASSAASEGFAYADDAFNGTAAPNFATGSVDPAGGFAGAGLFVQAGGRPGGNLASSGGWLRSFTLEAPAIATVRFRYRLLFSQSYEDDEFGEALFELDGVRYGDGPGSSLARFAGDGNGGSAGDTGWRLATFEIPLAAGGHTLALGAHSSKSTADDEVTSGWFDDVEVAIPATGGGVLENDSGDAPIAVLYSGPAHGTLALNEDGSFVYQPDPDYAGPDSFTYRAGDASGTSAPATVAITVRPVNDAPVAVPDAYPTREGQPVLRGAPGVLGNDLDPENDALTAVRESDVANGTLQLNADGSFIYRPAEGFFGIDSFSYRAHDGAAASEPVVVTIEVAPINDPPVAADDAYTTVENTPITVTIASGLDEVVFASDFDGTSVPAAVSGPAGLESVQGYEGTGPSGNTFSGQFLHNSAEGNPAEATVLTLTGLPPHQSISLRFLLAVIDSWDGNNDNFIVTLDGVEIFNRNFRNNGGGQTYPYPAGSLLFRDREVAFSVDGNTFRDAAYDMGREPAFRDIPHSASTATIRWFASGGNWGGGDDESWAIDNLEVTVSDAPVESFVAAGASWSFLDDGSNQGTAWRAPGFDDSSWASGPAQLGYGDGDEATMVSFGSDNGDKHITTYFRHRFEVTEADEIDGLVVGLVRDDGGAVYLNGTLVAIDNLDPGAAFSTPANLNPGLTYENVWNEFPVPAGLLVEGTNVLAVEIHQDDPGSSDISMDLYLEGRRVAGAGVLANDTDPEGDRLTAELVAGPQHGTLVLDPEGTFLYTPALNYEGPDSFTYRAGDGEFWSAPATVSVTVTSGANDLPVTSPDAYTATEDTPLIVPSAAGVLANDSDPDSPSLTAVLDAPPANGVVALAGSGGFTYVPHANFAGADSFAYRATDGIDASPPQVVTVTVTPVNDPPAAAGDQYLTAPGEALHATSGEGVLANDSDPDDPVLTAVLVAATGSGALSLNPDGSFSYTPDEGFSGSDSFSYRATDGALQSATVTATIHVNAAPVARDDSFATSEDTALILSPGEGLLANDTDADALAAVLVTQPAHGTLSLSSDGSFLYLPEEDFFGTDTFTYRATDSLQDSVLATVTLSVAAVNDQPRTRDDAYEVDADQLLAVAVGRGVLANDSDVDGPGLAAVLVSDVTSGELALAPDGSFTYQPAAGYTGTDAFTYRASDGLAASGDTEVMIEVRSPSQNIVINEIMFHPPSENDFDEFIELANTGTVAVDLTGWRFTNGIDFTFPSVSIPPGGFLVVAADLPSFEALHGVLPSVVGNWTGKLSNSGERIELEDAAGVRIDEVRYADQGEWATRARVTEGGEAGWRWVTAADAQGSSIELVNPKLGNAEGQNWAASANNLPTPGSPNSVASGDIAPMILGVEHVPAVPTSGDPITIVAELRDEIDGSASGMLYHRVSTASPGPFTAVTMQDDGSHGDAEAGDGLYGAVLPPMPNGTIVEFYVESSDGTNVRTWPKAATNGQTANALFQVDDEANTYDHAFYRIILPVPEHNQWRGINRNSNAMMNATLILDDGSGPRIRYLAGMRVRGAGSRSHTPAPMRLALPRDDEWNDATEINLNTRFPHLQFIGMQLFQAAGMRAPDTSRVQVRMNGVNIARHDAFDYGAMVHVQPLGGEFIDDKFANDNGGNLYKKVRPDRDFRWRDGNIGGYEADGWSKGTNSSENDWSDLDALLDVMNNASGDPDYLRQVETVADVEQWMKWFAAMTILANGETNISNGADDDFSMYRGALDPRFVSIPHDLDTILSLGDGSRIENPAHTLFDMIERGDTLAPLQPFFTNPVIVRRYYMALRELTETAFSDPEFSEILENGLRDWVPDATIARMRDFLTARRDFIEAQITPVIGPPAPRTGATSVGTVTSAPGPLCISEVLAINGRTRVIDGTRPDAVELHNRGPVELPLDGMSLSDDPLVPARFVFPPGTNLPSGGYLVVWGGDPLATPGLYLGFALDGEGESLSLYDAPARGAALLDRVTFGLQIADHSIGRTGADAATWRLCEPTLGAANSGVAYGDPSRLRINEWMSQHDLRFEDDFVELYNPEAAPVALGSLQLTDDPVNDPGRHRVADLSFIAPNGFAVFEALGDSADPARANELPFQLSSQNEWIALRGDNSVPIDQVHFVNQRADLSRGRDPDGGSTYRDFVVPTPGFSNTEVFANESLLLQNLRISEIMYHPLDGSEEEFIELQNVGSEPIRLAGVRFTEGIQFDFPDLVLGPGEFVLVVGNLLAFEARYGGGLPVAGQFSGKLDNGGERLRLEIAGINAGIHDFEFDDAWYSSTDGGGFSLDFLDPAAPIAAWGEKRSWAPSLAIHGTPGDGGLFMVRSLAPEAVALPEDAALATVVTYGPHSPAGASFAWRVVSGPGPVTFSTPQKPDTTASFAVPGIYTLRLEASAPGSETAQTLVLPVYDTYAAWVVRHFGAEDPAVTGKDRDPDRDGIVNLFEFAVRMDPRAPDAEFFPTPVFDPDENALTLTFAKNFVDPARLAVIPEVSGDLLDWMSGPIVVSQEVVADQYGLQVLRAVDHRTAATERTHFLRLRVVCTETTGEPDVLRILAITGAPHLPAIEFTSVAGERYQLEFTSDPPAGWTEIGLPVTAESGVTTLEDTTASGDPFRLYRVRRIP